jgi:outer membrane protein OmpA-like peptidoglycan-associated protein
LTLSGAHIATFCWGDNNWCSATERCWYYNALRCFAQRAFISIIVLWLYIPAWSQGQGGADTFRLYFDLNVPALNANTQKRIDLLIYNDKIINGSNIIIVGYADYLGTEEHNRSLSSERAENVKNYLVHDGINASDIKLCIGKGEVLHGDAREKGGIPYDRRVDIVIPHDLKKTAVSISNKKDTPVVKRVRLSDLTEMSTLKPGTTVVLNNVYFLADRHVIRQESFAALEKLYNVLQDNPKLKIKIEGHVCCISDFYDAIDIDTGEPILSVNRAKAIYEYLAKKGIDELRLQYEGFGRSRPIIKYEKTEEDAEKNRRVEIRIIENN